MEAAASGDILSAPSTKGDVLGLGAKIDSKIDALLTSMTKMENALAAVATDLRATKEEVTSIALQTDKNERKIAELEKEVGQLSIRITDLVNRNKRRNLRIKNFPANIPQNGLVKALISWWKSLNITIDPAALERVHRSSFQPRNPNVPRDLLVAFSSERKCAETLKHLRSLHPLKYKDHKILVFPDLALETVKDRNSLRPITHQLMEHNIKFFWAFPAVITVIQQGKRLTARTLEEGDALLQALGIAGSTSPQNAARNTNSPTESDQADPNKSEDSNPPEGAARIRDLRELRNTTVNNTPIITSKEKGGKSKKRAG